MKFIKNEKGQSLVEFALVVPILMLILMAIFEFAFMFNSYLVISNASREGARLASLGGTDIQIEERVLLVASSLDTSSLSVNISPLTRERGDMVTVSVIYDYTLVSPLISGVLSPLINMDSQTHMRVE